MNDDYNRRLTNLIIFALLFGLCFWLGAALLAKGPLLQ